MTLHRIVLAAALAFCPPVAAQACDAMSPHFAFCPEGTAWADGTLKQGGDSAVLYLGKFGFEGYEDYIGHEKANFLTGPLDLMLRETAPNRTRVNHVRDQFTTADLKIVRSIDTEQYQSDPPTIFVMMIAQAPDRSRIELSLRAPADTPIAELDRLSRGYAALVRPGLPNKDE